MKDAHLSLETLAKWLSGDLAHEELVGAVVGHFVARCETCRERYQRVQQLQAAVQHWDERVAVFESREATELLERLSAMPFDEQMVRARDDEAFQTWGLCQLLLRRSLEAVPGDPSAAVDLAEVACQIARRLDDAYDPHWVKDLRAKASAYLGNARRALGELRSAESAFREAERLLAESMTGNLQIEAEVLDLKAALRREQGRLEEASELLDRIARARVPPS